MHFIKHYEKLLNQEEFWSIAFRRKNSQEEFFADMDKPQFTEMPPSKRYWYADPFLFENAKRTYLFFEMFDRLKKKGCIGYCLMQKGTMSQPKMVLERNYHLSFPFLFTVGNNIYMIPEANESGEVKLFKATEFPLKWNEDRTLITNIRACDSVIINYGSDNNWILTSAIVSNDTNWLQNRLYHFDFGTLSVSSSYFLAKSGDKGVRNAGNCFVYKGMLIRPSQDCGDDEYGKALIFWQVRRCCLNEYNEEFYKKVDYKDILTLDNCHVGVHTYEH